MHEFNFYPESGHLYHNDRLMEIVPIAVRAAFSEAAGTHGINVVKPNEEPKRTFLFAVPAQKQQPK